MYFNKACTYMKTDDECTDLGCCWGRNGPCVGYNSLSECADNWDNKPYTPTTPPLPNCKLHPSDASSDASAGCAHSGSGATCFPPSLKALCSMAGGGGQLLGVPRGATNIKDYFLYSWGDVSPCISYTTKDGVRVNTGTSKYCGNAIGCSVVLGKSIFMVMPAISDSETAPTGVCAFSQKECNSQ